MPAYGLVFAKRFEDDFEKLPTKIQGQVLNALRRIQDNPFHAQKLKGISLGQWRYRVGDYRIRYDVVGQAIHLYVVRHRKDVYRR